MDKKKYSSSENDFYPKLSSQDDAVPSYPLNNNQSPD